ncbi:hypothetical protein Tco_0980292 [Tanacetum coccineum]
MNPQETQQVVARDEKWVPFSERVKISSTNIRLETTVPQKEETFQVVIDIIKNSTCFKAFTISADIPEIFMQQFWYTIKKVQGTDSYEFLLANKKCTINADAVPDDDTALTFLIDLGYKDPLNKHTNMFVDHMHQPWRTLAAIINKCLSGKTASNDKLRKSRIDILLKFVRISEYYQEYGLPIPDVMLTDAIKRSNHIRCSSNISLINFHPRRAESEPEPEPVKKKTTSRRVVKKKVTLSADDNIISDDSNIALELGKSISKTEAEEAEAARKKYGCQSSRSVVIQDTPSIGGSNEGTGTIPGVPNESTIVSTTSSEGTGAKPGVPDEEKDITEEKVILEWGDEQESEYSNDDDDDNDDVEKDDKDGDADDEGDDHLNEDVEMVNAKVKESDKGDEDVTDATKEDAEKTSEEKDDTKKTELPPSSSSLSVSSGFADQFLKLSSDSSLVSTVKDSADTDVSSLMDIPVQQETPQIQSPSVQKVPVLVIPETINLPPIPEIVTETSVSTAVSSPHVTHIISSIQQTPTPIPTQPITTDAPTIITAATESDALSAVELRVANLEKDVPELKTVDHSTEALVVLKSQFPTVVDSYLDSKVGDHLSELTKKPTPTAEQESEKSPAKILKIKREQAEMQKKPQFTIKSTDKAALEEYDLKSALYQSMHGNKSFNRNPANQKLYHALMEALIEDENAMDKGVVDTIKDHKRKHDDDDEDPPAGPNQGKQTKRRRTKESESSKKPSSTKKTPKVEEPIVEVIMDDAGDDVARDDVQPQDTSKPKTRKTTNPEWFKQPSRPPTPDPEWNKRQVILDQLEQPWFNQMVSASKDPLTFNDLMTTPIDLSNIELKYNFQECFNALTDKLDWNNPEGYRYPFDLSKPLPLQGPPGHRTVAVDYFFNNDLAYLMTSDSEVKYTSSITKTKAARYEIKGIEDMTPTLWSTIKHAYNKDAEKGIKHWGEGRKLWYRSHVSKFSKHNVYSTKAFLGVKSLFHLDGNDIVDFIVALRMFTRSLIIKKRVEDLQLGVESYQKKLNITKPQKTFSGIEFKEPYTPSYDPPGAVYKDLNKQKIVMQADELYKFSDVTLKSVRDELHHRVLDFRLDYNTEMPRRKWTAIDRKRSGLMVDLINKQLREREIIRNLERLVGARELEMDYKLMTYTI